MKETSTEVGLGTQAWAQFRLQTFLICVCYQGLDQPHWWGMKWWVNTQWHFVCKPLFIRKEDCRWKPTTCFSNVFSWHLSRHVKDEKRCPCEKGEWSHISSCTAGVATKMRAAPRALKNPGTWRIALLSPELLLPVTPTDPRPAGLIKAHREEWRKQQRPEIPTKTVLLEAAGLPRYSLRHCLWTLGNLTNLVRGPRSSAPALCQASTSAKTWEARNCSRSSHIPSPVYHKGSRNSVSMYFNGFVANIIFAVK